MATLTNEQILDAVAGMTVNELVALTKEIEERFEVSVVDLQPTVPLVEEVAPEDEQTEFDVVIEKVGEKKIEVIKRVRPITGFGLKESKEATFDGSVIAKALPREEAEGAKRALEEAGATVALA